MDLVPTEYDGLRSPIVIRQIDRYVGGFQIALERLPLINRTSKQAMVPAVVHEVEREPNASPRHEQDKRQRD